jgi:hypothetical protein
MRNALLDFIRAVSGRKPITDLAQRAQQPRRIQATGEAGLGTDTDGTEYFIPRVHGMPTAGPRSSWRMGGAP